MKTQKLRFIFTLKLLPIILGILSHLFIGQAFATNDDTKDGDGDEKEFRQPDPPPGVNEGIGIELVFVPQEFLDHVEASGRTFDNIRLDMRSNLYKDLDKILVKAHKAWVEKIKQVCEVEQDCTVKILSEEGIRVTFTDEFWYEVNLDVGAVEITTKPLNFRGWKSRFQQIQKYFFDFAKSLNLVVDPNRGMHIHLDISHFDDDPLVFMKFFNDCQNHPELFLGIFGLRPNNPPLATRSDKMRAAYQKVLYKFLQTRHYHQWSIESLAQEIYNKVYKIDDEYDDGNASFRDYEKRRNFALNLENLLLHQELTRKKNPFKTLEIRGLESQESALEVLLVIQYFYFRIFYVKTSDDASLLKYNNYSVPLERRSKKIKGDAPHPERIRKVFKKLIKEIQLNWQDYKKFLVDLIAEREISGSSEQCPMENQ